MNLSLSQLCEKLNLNLVLMTKENLHADLIDQDKIDKILLATGNIIDEQTAEDFKVINSHPGYLPNIKGLDALKWAILHKQDIGVTTHFINGQIDGGTIIERKLVPVHYEDTFHNVAYRQYEIEVDLLVNSLTCTPENIEISESPYDTFRRMPNRLEYGMLETFDELRKEQDNP